MAGKIAYRGYNARRDQNERDIIEALQYCGASVWQLDKPADLLVLFRGALYLLEVKTHKGKLTADEAAFFDALPEDAPAWVVRTPEEALKAIGAI